MRYDAITPDLPVKCPVRGGGCDAVGVVLHKRTPPEGECATAVYVMWSLGAPSWADAGNLAPRGMLPGVPNLLEGDGGSDGHDRTFWRGGEQYLVTNRRNGEDGYWDVAHRAEDGTLSRIVARARRRDTAYTTAVTAILGFESIRNETVSYLIEAENSAGQPLRVDVDGANRNGRVPASTVREGLRTLEDVKSGVRFDAVKGKDVRNRVHALVIYPVRHDGTVGVPRRRSGPVSPVAESVVDGRVIRRSRYVAFKDVRWDMEVKDLSRGGLVGQVTGKTTVDGTKWVWLRHGREHLKVRADMVGSIEWTRRDEERYLQGV